MGIDLPRILSAQINHHQNALNLLDDELLLRIDDVLSTPIVDLEDMFHERIPRPYLTHRTLVPLDFRPLDRPQIHERVCPLERQRTLARRLHSHGQDAINFAIHNRPFLELGFVPIQFLGLRIEPPELPLVFRLERRGLLLKTSGPLEGRLELGFGVIECVGEFGVF